MARAPRDQGPGIFHVNTHSVWSMGLFPDTIDYEIFGAMIARTVARKAWTCLAAVLMPNHYHLVLEVDSGTLPIGMRELNHGFARDFNRRHRLRGHVFAARFDARRIDTEAYLLAAYRYVVRNPVRAGLCESPEDWPWSSYAGSVGLGTPFLEIVDASRVIGCFGHPREVAIARLRAFVAGHDPAAVPARSRSGARLVPGDG
jgi:putative transposase